LKFDPRTKLLAIAVLTALAVLAPDIIYLAGGLAFTLTLALMLGVNLWTAIIRLRYFILAAIIIAAVQGLLPGTAFFLRMSIILAASSIAITSGASEMKDALIKLKFPYEIAFMVVTALRFFPLLREELSNRIKAVAARGVDIRKLRLSQKFKAYAYVLSPAVVGCVIKSRALAHAMTARAFRAYNTRTMYRQLKFGLYDYIIFFLLIAYITAFITLYFTIGRFNLI